MNRVVVHAHINDAHSDAAPETGNHRGDGWGGDTVESEPVELHRGGIRNGVVWEDGPLLKNHAKIVIGAGLVGALWMRDEESNHTHHFLHGAVGVIEECALLMDREFVGVFFAWRDGLLADPRHAVLLYGNFEAVPVNRSGFGQAVFEDDAHAFALLHLNRGAGARAVVAPCVDRFEWSDFSFHWLCDQMENFYGAVRLVRQIRQVRREHGQPGIGPRRCNWDRFFPGTAVGTVVAALFHFAGGLWVVFRRVAAQGFR